MTIQFKCSACQAPLSAPDEMAGRKAKCRQCGGVLQVPDPAADRWPPGMAPRPSSPQAPAKSEPRPASAPPVRKPAPAAPAAKIVTPPTQSLQTPIPQAPIKTAVAVPVVPVPGKQSPPPLAVPIAVPVAGTTSAAQDVPIARPVTVEVERSPLDEIAAMLEFEQSAPRAPSPGPLDINPYRSPAPLDRAPKAARDDNSEFTRITYGETVRAAWEILKANFWPLVGATALYSVSMGFIQGILGQIVEQFGQAVAARGAGSTGLAIVVVTLYLLTLLAIFTFFTLGYLKYIVQVTRGKPAEVSMIFSSLPRFVPGYLLFLAIFSAVIVGSVLLIVPGLLAGLLFALAPVAFVDKDSGVVESLRASASIMSKNLLPAFLLLFTVGMAGNVLVLVTCGLASLVVTPFHMILASVIYLRASGRRTAVD